MCIKQYLVKWQYHSFLKDKYDSFHGAAVLISIFVWKADLEG
jgi:hypothetical protein